MIVWESQNAWFYGKNYDSKRLIWREELWFWESADKKWLEWEELQRLIWHEREVKIGHLDPILTMIKLQILNLANLLINDPKHTRTYQDSIQSYQQVKFIFQTR